MYYEGYVTDNGYSTLCPSQRGRYLDPGQQNHMRESYLHMHDSQRNEPEKG